MKTWSAPTKSTKIFSSDKKKSFRRNTATRCSYEHHTTSLVFNDPPAIPASGG